MVSRPHRNLEVWKQSIQFVLEVYKQTRSFPAEEKFGLTSQLRRASVSVPANISEGAARNTKKEFLHFLHIAQGSLSEIDTLLVIANGLEFLSLENYETLDKTCNSIAAMLNGLIRKVKTDIAAQERK